MEARCACGDLIRSQLTPALYSNTPLGTALFFVTLEASPKPSHPRYGETDGAFVSCWVNEPTAELAQIVARTSAEANGWDVVDLDECRRVVREEFVEKPESLALFDQARIDGLVLAFHTWPVGGDDE